MALIKCPECKKKISDQCGKCPNCGYPIEIVKTHIEELDVKTIENEVAIAEKTDKPRRKPINKKTLIGIISAIIILLTIGGFSGYKALLPRINAIKNFNKAVKFVEQKNTELENKILESEELVEKKQPLLDKTLVSKLENAISDTKSAKVTNFKTPRKLEDIIDRTEELYNIDYSETIENLNKKHTALEINAKRYQLVDAPIEAYIIKCLKQITDITGISAATEDNDPNGKLNKDGGYISQVYFSHKSVNQKEVIGDTLIEKGTDAGGSIEVYKTATDAEKRRDYLAGFDGSILSSGTHTVVGTVLVRTSDELTASKQKELEEAIISELTYLKEIDGERKTETKPSKNESNNSSSKPITTNTSSTQTKKPNKSNEKEKALKVAKDLCDELDDGDVRRNWLKGWLIETEGFSESAATYAVKNIDYDWYAAALSYANAYEYWGESTNDIPSLLLNDGFTSDEVSYACENADWNKD